MPAAVRCTQSAASLRGTPPYCCQTGSDRLQLAEPRLNPQVRRHRHRALTTCSCVRAVASPTEERATEAEGGGRQREHVRRPVDPGAGSRHGAFGADTAVDVRPGTSGHRSLAILARRAWEPAAVRRVPHRHRLHDEVPTSRRRTGQGHIGGSGGVADAESSLVGTARVAGRSSQGVEVGGAGACRPGRPLWPGRSLRSCRPLWPDRAVSSDRPGGTLRPYRSSGTRRACRSLWPGRALWAGGARGSGNALRPCGARIALVALLGPGDERLALPTGALVGDDAHLTRLVVHARTDDGRRPLGLGRGKASQYTGRHDCASNPTANGDFSRFIVAPCC